MFVMDKFQSILMEFGLILQLKDGLLKSFTKDVVMFPYDFMKDNAEFLHAFSPFET